MHLFRGGVEDTRLEAKAKDTKKIQGQGQPYQSQTLLRPRTQTQMLFKKKVFRKNFQAIHKLLTTQKILLSSGRGQGNF